MSVSCTSISISRSNKDYSSRWRLDCLAQLVLLIYASKRCSGQSQEANISVHGHGNPPAVTHEYYPWGNRVVSNGQLTKAWRKSRAWFSMLCISIYASNKGLHVSKNSLGKTGWPTVSAVPELYHTSHATDLGQTRNSNHRQ